ncbi:MAG: DUF1853 family protein [Pricia sp.]
MRQFKFPGVDLSGFTPKSIPERLRLGHRMEHIFKQLIITAPEYDLLLYNRTVTKNKRSVGEIDFILQDIAYQRILHVELTYKFYIIDTRISEPIHQLIGPNRRDMFFTKMEKIKHRQFPLLHTAEGKDVLEQNGIDHEKIEHQCCFKGQLFYPYGEPNVHIRPLNKACLQGFWLRFNDFNAAEFREYSFYIPFKFEWVIAPHQEVEWQSHFEILMELNLRMIKENAPMVWMRKSESEVEKFFVVWW